jgi:Xaa-Pro aminopeptidase
MSTIAVIGGYGMKDLGVRNPYTFKSREKWFESNLPFSIEEYEGRIRMVQKRARKDGLDGIIVHGDRNENGFVRWLSNFAPLYGSTYIVVPSDGEVTLVSDSVLHGEPMHSHWWTTWIPDVRPTKHSLEAITEALSEVLQEKHLLQSTQSNLGWAGDYGFPIDRIQSKIVGANLRNYNEELLELKAIKSPKEVSIMKKCLKITSDAMQAGCQAIKPGVSENKIAGILNGTMMSEGAQDLAFFTMVVSGPRTTLKHAYPTERQMKKGDMVYIDMGACYYGYMSDMSRTLTIGSPNEKQKEILDLAYEMHRSTVKMMKPGASCSEIAEKAYQIAEEAGFERDTYVGGHGLGTTLFDLPVILPRVTTRLAENMIFAYEPMIVPMDIGTGVVEDDYLVTDSSVERLTKFDQKLW